MQNVALFCNLVALILGRNCVKIQNSSKIKLQWASTKLEVKSCFQRQSWTKCLRQTLVFIWNRALRQNFDLYFLAVFRYYQQNFYFGKKTGREVVNLWSLEIFLMFNNFIRFQVLGRLPTRKEARIYHIYY